MAAPSHSSTRSKHENMRNGGATWPQLLAVLVGLLGIHLGSVALLVGDHASFGELRLLERRMDQQFSDVQKALDRISGRIK